MYICFTDGVNGMPFYPPERDRRRRKKVNQSSFYEITGAKTNTVHNPVWNGSLVLFIYFYLFVFFLFVFVCVCACVRACVRL